MNVEEKLRVHQPEAQGIRLAGNCPHCRTKTLYSYTIPSAYREQIGDQVWEHCAYYCSECEWSERGRRWAEV